MMNSVSNLAEQVIIHTNWNENSNYSFWHLNFLGESKYNMTLANIKAWNLFFTHKRLVD